MKKVRAFSFAAGEFLEEEIDELSEKLGSEHPFIKEGEYRKNKDSDHPHEWWAPEEACKLVNELNKE